MVVALEFYIAVTACGSSELDRERQVPLMSRCRWLARLLSQELLLVAAEMADGSYWREEPYHEFTPYHDPHVDDPHVDFGGGD